MAVKAASINPIDYKIVEGKLKDMLSLNLPFSIGYDLSGVVVEKGSDVLNFEIGDEVYARIPQHQMGIVAAQATVRTDEAAKIPVSISPDHRSRILTLA
nr:alcohol dehydrogenase catalytic domain-containing protein [Marivirga sp.]